MIYTIIIALIGGLVLLAAWDSPLGHRRLSLNALSIIFLSLACTGVGEYFEQEWTSIPRLPPHLTAHPLNIHPTIIMTAVFTAGDLLAIYTLVRDWRRFRNQRR